jgi:hypothetical protein
MNSVYIAKGRPLFKGIKNLGPFNVNRSYRSRLFWLTKNATNAAGYGTVGLYKPKRKLRLLKLTYATVKKLIEDPNTSNNLRKVLEHTWGGPTNTYLNQYMKMRSIAWEAFYQKYRGLTESYNPNTGMITTTPINQINQIWKNAKGNPLRAGRISVLNMNVRAYGLLRNRFSDKYDGLWSPTVRSPYHGRSNREGKFGTELVIFKPDEVLDKEIYPPENLNKNFQMKNKLAREAARRAAARKWNKPKAIEGTGTLIYTARPRGRNASNVIAAKRVARWNKLFNNKTLNGPGKAFFKNNNSIVNSGSLFKNNNRKN